MQYFYVTQSKFNVRLSLLEEKFNSKKYRSTSLEKEFDKNGEHIRKERAFQEALRRAKRSIIDYAMSNVFQYFGTLTFSDKLVDVHSATGQVKALDRVLNFLHNYLTKCPDLKYLLVPEYGSKNGRLHFHFLLANIDEKDLFINENKHLDFFPFRSRFGHVQITKIGKTANDHRNTAIYIGKYITKDSLQLRSHRYFCSKNLSKPTKFCLDDYEYTMDIKKFLEEYGFTPYFKSVSKKVELYSLPIRVWYDLLNTLKLVEKRGRFYLFTVFNMPCPFLTDKLISINPKRFLARTEVVDSIPKITFEQVSL